MDALFYVTFFGFVVVALLLVGVASAIGEVTAELRKLDTKIEYQVIQAPSFADLESVLNRYGDKGWQLHSWRELMDRNSFGMKFAAVLSRSKEERQ